MKVYTKEPPKGATHKLEARGGVTYYRALDYEFGSYDFWNGREFYTKRDYPPKGIIKINELEREHD